jgi:hypothetical protein
VVGIRMSDHLENCVLPLPSSSQGEVIVRRRVAEERGENRREKTLVVIKRR